MKTLTAHIRRFALLCLAVVGLGESARAQAKVEAQVKGYAGYVLIDPSIVTGKQVVWKAALGRYVSGAVKRGEKLRLSGAVSDGALLTASSAGTSPGVSVVLDTASYVNTDNTVTLDTTVTKLKWTVDGVTYVWGTNPYIKDSQIIIDYINFSSTLTAPIVNRR